MGDVSILDNLEEQIRNLKSKHTYRQLVKLSGMERSRLFRILNGAEIKVSDIKTLLISGLIEMPSTKIKIELFKPRKLTPPKTWLILRSDKNQYMIDNSQ